MFKKSIASLLMLAMVFTFSTSVNAQESEDYAMWQNIMITPDYKNLKTLQENMRKHNETFHKDAPYSATVYNITTGPNAGNIIWQMGPMMFKHNDDRPGAGAHNEDWRDNIMPYVKKMHTVEYWSQDDKKSNTSMLGPDNIYPIMFIRYFEVSDHHDYTMGNVFQQASETFKSMSGENPWGLYYNQFLQGDLGRHVATVRFYKDWKSFEDNPSFKKAHAKLFGEDQWEIFMDTIEDTFDNQWDEIWVYNKNMSGD